MLYLEKYKKYKFKYLKQRGGEQFYFIKESLYHTNNTYPNLDNKDVVEYIKIEQEIKISLFVGNVPVYFNLYFIYN